MARTWCRWFRIIGCLLLFAGIAACANRPTSVAGSSGELVAPSRYYPPPGPPDDPWGPYISEAAARYDIPPQWIRAVMQQESAGQEQAVSPVGAIGLMQVMPGTYDELRDENGLGDDPFNPRDNILAGASYIKQMYERYGSPGFLAAYNAGPQQLDDYLAGNGPLPDETVNYLAAIAPNLGGTVPFSGPMAQYAVNGGGVAPTAAGFASGCDVNAAYDPDHPCAASAQAVALNGPVQVAAGSCNADAAYDPANPCSAGPSGAAGSCDADRAFDPDSPCTVVSQPVPAVAQAAPVAAAYQPVATAPAPVEAAPARGWGIQVGAFADPALARAVAENARAEAPDQLAAAAVALPTTAPLGGLVLYRARLLNLTASDALNACANLNRRQLPCLVLPASGA